jgi:NhaP-type Na+/H+ or K+/H+ antiporter
MSTITNSKPIYTAVLLDLETAEALQQQLSAPLLSHGDDDHDDDANALSSSTSSKSTSTAKTAKIVNFLAGICIGVIFSSLGFRVLVQHWHNMGQSDVMLFSVIWSSVTSAAAYIMFSTLYTVTCCYFGSSNNSDAAACMESSKLISILEYCFAIGVFLGFCGACTWTDVAYGMPASSIALTVVVAAVWACLMLYCAFATSKLAQDEEEEQLAQRRISRRGTVLPLVFV